jgi:protease I
MKKISEKRIVMVIAPSMFRDEEFQIPYKYFIENGALVSVASTTLNVSTGKLGLKVKPDNIISKINSSDFDAIVFVGGPGVKEFWNDKTIHKVAGNFLDSGKITAAICSAPVILSRAGLLKGKKVTSFSGDEEDMRKGGCMYTGKLVEKDGNIITGNGPGASQAFAELVANSL